MTEEQLKAMEASAPLLVAEVRRLQEEVHTLMVDKDLCLDDLHRMEDKYKELQKALALVVSVALGGG